MNSVTAKRFSIAEYHHLAELGFFAPDERVELIRGELIIKAAKSTFHSVCNSLLVEELIILLARLAHIRTQEPIILSTTDSEPEPDVVIARNRDNNYLASHPEPADILLVIKVSDSTLKYDQRTKLSLYAEAGLEVDRLDTDF